MITTILNIDTLNKILINIQEAVLFSKIHVVNSRILSHKEIHTVKTILNNQGVQLDIPEEALNFVTQKIATSENTLLYILHVPELEREESIIIRIYPLNQNNTVIQTYPQFIIKHGKQLFTTSNPEDYVQMHSYIKEFKDSCVYPLIMGAEPHCITEVDNRTSVKLITNNKILITNAKHNTLQSDCGPKNRYLSGNLVVSFSNCSVLFMGYNFTSKERISESETIQGAFHNLIINSEISKTHDVAKIEKATIFNRNQLDKVTIQHETDHIWKWSLLGGTSLTSMLLIFTLYLVILHLRSMHQRTSRKSYKKMATKLESNKTPPSNKDIEENQ